MPRPMSTAMLAALNASELFPAFFVTGTFASGPVYLWSGFGPIVWNGQPWQGVGTLGAISPIGDGSSIEARGITLTLSGIDPAMLTHVLAEFVLGQPVSVFVGLVD